MAVLKKLELEVKNGFCVNALSFELPILGVFGFVLVYE